MSTYTFMIRFEIEDIKTCQKQELSKGSSD